MYKKNEDLQKRSKYQKLAEELNIISVKDFLSTFGTSLAFATMCGSSSMIKSYFNGSTIIRFNNSDGLQ